jgi:hypothetical protein
MRILATLMMTASMLLVGHAALSRQSGVAATHAGNNSSLPAVNSILQAGTSGVSIALPPALVAAFVMMALALLGAVFAGGGR